MKYALLWMLIGLVSRWVRGRGIWWRYALLGPAYPLICGLVWLVTRLNGGR